MDPSSLHIPYALPVALLVAAFIVKFPTFLRAWRDTDVRATILLLFLAVAVFFSITPANIARINDATGVTNFAAPLAYSLLTTFFASVLTMTISWREQPSPRRRRILRTIWAIYAGIVAALWITFSLAEVPDERIYDIDTYYANTPWMREHVLLYLLAHTVSGVVAAGMIWTWVGKVSARWLRAGLVCLQVGYTFGLLFDIAKFIAIGARWADTDWDFLSTDLAPPFALLDAILVAIGFILPQVGPHLTDWCRDLLSYRRLQPLWRTLRPLDLSPAAVRVRPTDALSRRLMHRKKDIHDGLLSLGPYYDDKVRVDVHHAATRSGHDPDRADSLARTAALLAAIDTYKQSPDEPGKEAQPIRSDLPTLISMAHGLRRRRTVDTLRHQVATRESATARV
ncbi:MAB_1171c family putative transporter [Streptomyces sp. NPDC057074]|uniref:MAB_1171c family putative transporter n=1 Tax=Streptomyces sp. NPDC057074 TaxID=3346015 RepID=UPI00363B8E77